MIESPEVDSGVPLDVGRQIRANYARSLRLVIDGGAATMPPEAMPYHTGKSRVGHTLVGSKSIGPSGPGFLGSSSTYISCNTLSGGASDVLLELPAASDWSCQFVVDNIGAASGVGCWFRSGSTALSSNVFMIIDTRRPWVRINGTDVLRPSTGPQWTDGQTINLVVRNRDASRVEAWWDGILKHSATHSSSLPVTTGVDGIYYLLTSNFAENLRGNVAAIRFWSRWLGDEEVVELAADHGSLYEPPRALFPVPVSAGGAADLTLADASHAHAADSLSLTTASTLTIADATHAHTAEALSLTTASTLAVADALHDHAAEGLALTTESLLALQDALHDHAADAPELLSGSSLLIAEALQAHTADGLALVVDAYLTVANAGHGHTADALVLTVPSTGADPAAVWSYVLSNGKTAEENVVEILAKLQALHDIHGLTLGSPLTVSATARAAGTISQTISSSSGTTTVTRTS